jgi:glutamate/tyrosine decarboxylase-like PLP-dependent enzyme
MPSLLDSAHQRATRYLSDLPARRVTPTPEAIEALQRFVRPVPEGPTDPAEVLRELDDWGSPATVATAGGRYFGFVTGGSLPATTAAAWLAAAWDQNAAMSVLSPVAAQLEAVSLQWVTDLLGLPAGTGAGFVTGASLANLTALAAARHALLARQGWDVEAKGLFRAPEITVVTSDEVHSTVLKALAILGLGRDRLIRVPTDEQGRMRADQLPNVDERTLVCLQAGNVNTGSFDPFAAICGRAKAAGAWVHIDGAFGLWAAACPSRRHLVNGIDQADSWAVDCHKWLNTPYDAALALVRDPAMLRRAMAINASYLDMAGVREPAQYVPDLSRRARGVEVWAALRSLGRSGLANLIERTCRHAARFAQGLKSAGFKIHNDVVINQVLVSFGSADRTKRVIEAIQAEGTLWCGGSVWQGATVMRISVSSWATTDQDVERSLETIVRLAGQN